MDYLSLFDYTIIGIYLMVLVGLGLYLKKKASASMEDYFIGGRRLPWWALGVSGMASWLDVTGTMFLVSFVYMLGPRGLYIAFRSGAGLILVFMLLWTGKWHRRSQCLTGAEWMIYRFGDGFGGRFAQLAAVIAGLAYAVSMLGFLIKGMGLFLSMFLPYSPLTCSLVMIGVATLYTMVSGFYGVVFTDVFQSMIVVVAVVFISLTAAFTVADCESFTVVASEVTGQDKWVSSIPHLYTSMPKGYEAYRYLAMFAFFYLLKSIFIGAASGQEPRYFGARNDRECGTLSFLWSCLLMFRWPLIIGFAILGLFVVKDLYPDQAVLAQAAELIKQYVPGIEKSQWTSEISGIMHSPKSYSPELILQLKSLLGEAGWAKKLYLLSFEGTVNPERILPAVLLFKIRQGFRGLLLVALLAASMSSFDSVVNGTTAFLSRDVYQKYIRPTAKTKELIYISWGFSFGLVLLSFLFARSAESLNDILSWAAMGLWGGLLIPSFLRFYWWRFNGGGFAIGMMFGLCGATGQRILFPRLNELWQFLIVGAIGLVGTVVGTYLTRLVDKEVLENFYRTTRPFGFWGRLKEILPPDVRAATEREHRNDLLTVPFALLWHVTLLLLPMQLIIRTFKAFWVTLALFAIGLAGMYFFWYRNLPPAENIESAVQNNEQG